MLNLEHLDRSESEKTLLREMADLKDLLKRCRDIETEICNIFSYFKDVHLDGNPRALITEINRRLNMKRIELCKLRNE